jgi:hypothetical protein
MCCMAAGTKVSNTTPGHSLRWENVVNFAKFFLLRKVLMNVLLAPIINCYILCIFLSLSYHDGLLY